MTEGGNRTMDAGGVSQPGSMTGSIHRRDVMNLLVQVCSVIMGLSIMVLSVWPVRYALDNLFGSHGAFYPNDVIEPLLGGVVLWITAAIAAAPFRLYAKFLAVRIAGLVFGLVLAIGGGCLMVVAMLLYGVSHGAENLGGYGSLALLAGIPCFATSAVLLFKVRTGFRGRRL
jgi:hypothetical protein